MEAINDKRRDEILSCIINTPEILSDEDIELILADEELSELYRLAVMCKEAAVTNSVEILDVETELARFKASRMNKISQTDRWRPIMRVAAVFAGVVVTSMVAMAVFAPRAFGVFSDNSSEEGVTDPDNKHCVTEAAPLGGGEIIEIVNDKDLVYDNVPLETIVTELAAIYKVNAEWQREPVKSLRLYVKIEQGKSLKEAVQVLEAFEQFEISIDDDKLVIK